MRWKPPLVAVLLMVGGGALMFHFFQRQLSSASFAFGSHPEVLAHLEASLADLKRLAELDPANEADYRERFTSLERTVHRLQILERTRDDLIRRYETLLLAVFAASVVLVTGVYAYRQSRNEPRLDRLQAALGDLVEGKTDIEIGDHRRDTIGRIATMIERTSRVMARDRRRLAALQNLSAWQEAARRHAHEMRSPLTAAQLEMTRIEDLLRDGAGEPAEAARRAAASARQELGRLAEFTRRFTSFARLPQPELAALDLGELVDEFVATYGAAWSNLALVREPGAGHQVAADREMLRHVLVNLCDNSSQALAPHEGLVRFRLSRKGDSVRLDVADDGPGIADDVRSRLFEPYTTTRGIGEGMGLGLAISKKALLDHGGDLELLESTSSGATFRATLPATARGGLERSR